MAAISGTVLMNLGKQLLKDLTKKTVKGTAKKAVKAVVKKKKVKGKNVAKKMFGGGEEAGGAIVSSPTGSLVSAPGGALTPATQQKGGELVVTKSNVAKELGLSPFMDSLTSIQTNVDAIKAALNDNNKDTKDRIDDQRLLNAKLKKEEREAALEGKKPGKGKGLLSGAKDVAEGFLTKMARFLVMTYLGSLLAALMGGARDVILAFRIGIEALKKGLPPILKGVKALKSSIGKVFNLALKPFKSFGNLLAKGFKNLAGGLIKWVGKLKGALKGGLKTVGNVAAKVFPKAASALNKGKDFVKTQAGKAKGFIKNTARKIGVGAKRFIGRGARKFLKGGGKKVGSKILKGGGKKVGSKILKHGLKRGANRLIVKWFGKGAAKTLATVGKTLVKGAKAIKIPVIGPLLVAITSMFSGDPIGKTLFKTAGAAIGGGLGLALGPIGMIVGEIAGEFVGDVLFEAFMTGKGGMGRAGKKLKDKFMQILSGGKKVMNWLKNSIGRINWKKLAFSSLKDKVTVLKDAFFPPAEMAASKPNTDGEDVSESASYEDGGEEEPTVVIDEGGEQAAAPASQAGQVKFIPLDTSDSSEVLNKLTNATLYKV